MILNRELYKHFSHLRGIIIIFKIVIRRFSKSLLNKESLSKGDFSNISHSTSFLGHPYLTYTDKDELRCTSCNLCSDVCPTSCISIESKGVEKTPLKFDLDISNCVFCGECINACPVDALRFDNLSVLSSQLTSPLFDIKKLSRDKSMISIVTDEHRPKLEVNIV